MEFCALASGSSGNCFYVKEGNSAVLIDAGISAKQILERLSSIKQSPKWIKGIFVTHEHTDHIRGIDVFASKHNIPIYMTKGTAESSCVCREDNLVNVIKNNEHVKLNGLSVEAFSKSHDAADPVSYSVSAGGKRVAVVTDIGFACKNVIDHISCAHSVILESNHDTKMLEDGNYPIYLKRRIASDKGHISNYNAALLLLQHGPKGLKNAMLAHLSENNNTPDIALKTFELLKERKDLKVNIKLSLRDSVSECIKLK
ncbi:MAG: MBL fold metallo-hydrolase [Nanoarchaeota archaeon]|nr:MBL fold metallo-hydrolase [Nanoarchaeota archaeon]